MKLNGQWDCSLTLRFNSLWGTGLDVAVHRDFWGFQEQVTVEILYLRVIAYSDTFGGSWLFALKIQYIFLCSYEYYNYILKNINFKWFIKRRENTGHGIPIKVNWHMIQKINSLIVVTHIVSRRYKYIFLHHDSSLYTSTIWTYSCSSFIKCANQLCVSENTLD